MTDEREGMALVAWLFCGLLAIGAIALGSFVGWRFAQWWWG